MEEDTSTSNLQLQNPNDLIIQGTSDLYFNSLQETMTMYLPLPVVEPVPRVLPTHEPLDLSRPTSNENVIDLTNDVPASPASSDDCIAILPDGSPMPSNSSSTKNNESLDESVSIVYENIKPPPDLNVEFEQGSGDLILEILKRNPEPFSGCLTKKLKCGSNNVSVSVAVKTKRIPISSDTPQQVTQKIRGKISVPNLFENNATASQPEKKSTSSSNTNTVTCGVCLDTYDEIMSSGDRHLVSTACGHVFCNNCMELCRKNSKLCPKCRKKLTKKQYHPLYFS